MPDTDKPKKERAKIIRWEGVLAGKRRMLRWMIALVLAVASITFTFSQLGFVGVTLPDGNMAYVVVLLQLIALGTLLLGTLPGTALGLVSGIVLFVHARFLPLDHYELSFVTPVTSIVMFGVCGLLLGVFFAFALRNNPTRVKRIIYISIICILVSWLYSIGFAVNVFTSLVLSIFESTDTTLTETTVSQYATSFALQLGDINMQAWITALLMAILCCVGDHISCRVGALRSALGLRTVFSVWLCVVVALAFMAMSAVSFAVTSGDELHDASDMMKNRANFLYSQLQLSEKRLDNIAKIYDQGQLNFDKVDESLLADTADSLEDRALLEGYSLTEDGIVIVTIGNVIYASNDERVEGVPDINTAFFPNAIEAIETSKKTGTMQRFVFDNFSSLLYANESNDGTNADATPRICNAYVYARNVDDINSDETAKTHDIDESIIIIQTSDTIFAKRPLVMIWTTLSSLVLMIAVMLIVLQLLNRVVAQRIDETNGVLARVTEGDLDARININDTREFESLSHGINGTVDALKGWIAEAETRMDAELAAAKAIQEAALPRIFPPFPDILHFDIYASMNAAKEVGGDFYDFFLIGDECDSNSGKLGFVIADVSGKGIPAALFMMKAKTQIHDYMTSGMELGEAIENANRQLCDGNDAGMFVTVFAGILDYATWHVDFVNAGHNPPLLWRQNGTWEWVKEKSGLPLGLFDGLPYTAHSYECEVGEQFFLYTDGVTEAMSKDGDLYGEERLEAILKQNYPLHPHKLVHTVRQDVAMHAQGAEQSDDITILALEVGVPPEITATITVPAKTSELPRVNEFIHSELDRRLCPLRAQNQLDIAVEELFVNVAHYAYPEATPDDPGTVHISYTYTAEPPAIKVDIIDDGIPYNPLVKPDAVTPSNIEDVPIGGLGILMAKRSVDEMRYERVDSSNVVSIIKKW